MTTSFCPCEHERHIGRCSGKEYKLSARVEYLGVICDACAVSCVSDYLVQVGLYDVVAKDDNLMWCHIGSDGSPSCVGHPPTQVNAPYAFVESNVGEILADFYGPERMLHARVFALAMAQRSVA